MVTSSNGNIFRVTGHLCGEFTGLRWIPRTKASDAELWCFLWSVPDKRLSKQSWGWWFETQSGSLWRHSNEGLVNLAVQDIYPVIQYSELSSECHDAHFQFESNCNVNHILRDILVMNNDYYNFNYIFEWHFIMTSKLSDPLCSIAFEFGYDFDTVTTSSSWCLCTNVRVTSLSH